MPVAPGDLCVGRPCHICQKPLRVGEVPSLVSVAPADEEQAERAREGRPYNAQAALVHWDCVKGRETLSDRPGAPEPQSEPVTEEQLDAIEALRREIGDG